MACHLFGSKQSWACFRSLAWSKPRLCLANHRAGYFTNLVWDWLSIVWAYSEQETENGPRSMLTFCQLDPKKLTPAKLYSTYQIFQQKSFQNIVHIMLAFFKIYITIPSQQYTNSHCKGEIVSQPSFHYNGNPHIPGNRIVILKRDLGINMLKQYPRLLFDKFLATNKAQLLIWVPMSSAAHQLQPQYGAKVQVAERHQFLTPCHLSLVPISTGSLVLSATGTCLGGLLCSI